MLPITALYIHFPWCIRKCPYCDFNSYAIKEVSFDQKNYIQALKNNLSQAYNKWSIIYLSTIYIGGGTPSLIDASNIKELLDFVQNTVPCSNDLEISMEMNPGTVNKEKLIDLKGSINRISFGVQSFTDQSLKTLRRIHNAKQALDVIKLAQDLGYEKINVDLMHDLPNQTLEQAIFDLNTAIELKIPHISWYQLTIEEDTEFAQYKDLNIPHEDLLYEIDKLGQKLLSDHNYTHYEISGFAQEPFYCKHNLAYWNYLDYLGIGAGAHSKITSWETKEIYRLAQDEHPLKFINNKNYLTNLYKVDPSNLPFEYFLNKARLLTQKINLNNFEHATFLDPSSIEKQLKRAEDLELITRAKEEITLTDFGKRYLNSFLELFLP